MINIFVAKLDYEIQGEDLRDLFEEFGTVNSAKVVFDKFTSRSRGFGFVEMANEEEGLKAIEELNNSDYEGRNIVVKKAEPKRESSFNRW